MRPPPSKPTDPAAPSYRSGPKTGLRGARLCLSSKTRLGGELSLHVGGGAQPATLADPEATSQSVPVDAGKEPHMELQIIHHATCLFATSPLERQLPHVC